MTSQAQLKQLRRMGRRMIYLEQIAQRAELRGDANRADEFWFQRETIQWMRSLLLRDTWAQDRLNVP